MEQRMDDLEPQYLPHILVVDDDDRLRELLRKFLSEGGFLVATAEDAAEARAHLSLLAFDLVVLDLMMPGESGLDLAGDLRRGGNVPILMLTAMDTSEDRISGLEHGADDYLTKPFEPRELLLRIRAILRRVPIIVAETASEICLGAFTFDPLRGALHHGGKLVHLTTVEAALLSVLAAQPGTIFDRDALMIHTGAAGGGRAIDVQVTRLRRKIEPDSRLPRYLQTVRGRGYVLHTD
jgi:two-component system phosphate regulon response regulator OmpR